MSNSPLYNSPNRSANVKRKMPDSFYRPPVLKTQLFSASEILPRSIHHSYTNSLPVETPAPITQTLNSSGSANNIYEKSLSHNQPALNQTNQTNQIYNHFNDQLNTTYSPLVNKPNENQYFHSKTFSLPVSFEPNQPNPYPSSSQTFMPPVRNFNPNGDIPLPPGWQCEKAPNGQFYYINHFTKTTTWDDPRKLYNLPTNQCDMSTDLRSTITKTIPLPNGWEESRTANGEVYYIDHINKATCWEDPRINIYMQQQQQKIYSNQQYNYNNSFIMPNSGASSQFSNSSSSLSIASTSSGSITSLSNSSHNLFRPPVQNLITKPVDPKEQNIINLKNNLDDVLSQKKYILRQLEELNKHETNLKSNLSPQDLDDVLKTLKKKDVKMISFSTVSTNNQSKIKTEAITPLKNNTNNNLNKSIADKENTNGDMDSTFVAENCANNMVNNE